MNPNKKKNSQHALSPRPPQAVLEGKAAHYSAGAGRWAVNCVEGVVIHPEGAENSSVMNPLEAEKMLLELLTAQIRSSHNSVLHIRSVNGNDALLTVEIKVPVPFKQVSPQLEAYLRYVGENIRLYDVEYRLKTDDWQLTAERCGLVRNQDELVQPGPGGAVTSYATAAFNATKWFLDRVIAEVGRLILEYGPSTPAGAFTEPEVIDLETESDTA